MLYNTLRLLLLENYSHFSTTVSSKNNRVYSKKQVCLYSWDYTINHYENEDENEK